MSQRGLVGVYSESDDIPEFPPKKHSLLLLLFFFLITVQTGQRHHTAATEIKLLVLKGQRAEVEIVGSAFLFGLIHSSGGKPEPRLSGN